MDYTKMLKFHIANEAAATIAVLEVPMEEAHRFGIMNTDETGRIVSFEEKPKVPKSNNASMGIYIFNWKILREYMARDDADPNSENDFGKNIIPAMLNAGEKMVAYPFEGYWKDVGTIQSLWEANMDLLGETPVLDLNDPAWRIYTRNPVMPPHYTGRDAEVKNSLVAEGCVVRGKVTHTVLFCGAKADDGSTIVDSVVFPNAVIGRNCLVKKAIVGENAIIGDGVVIGAELREGETVDNRLTGDIALIGNDVTIPKGTVIPCGAVVTAETIGQFINGGKEA
jgi:glucose-1-phosphate adenylyltransferase